MHVFLYLSFCKEKDTIIKAFLVLLADLSSLLQFISSIQNICLYIRPHLNSPVDCTMITGNYQEEKILYHYC